jgi:ATP-dependent Clp protease ATP-binding subunit ClpA
MTLSDEVDAVLHRAFVAACEAGHTEITPEHIALELIDEGEIATYLTRCGTDLVAVDARLRAYLKRIEQNGGAEMDAQPASDFQQVVDAAIERTEGDSREHVMLRDLFLALIDEEGSTASVAILEATREPQVFEELRTYRSDEDPGRPDSGSRRPTSPLLNPPPADSRRRSP